MRVHGLQCACCTTAAKIATQFGDVPSAGLGKSSTTTVLWTQEQTDMFCADSTARNEKDVGGQVTSNCMLGPLCYTPQGPSFHTPGCSQTSISIQRTHQPVGFHQPRQRANVCCEHNSQSLGSTSTFKVHSVLVQVPNLQNPSNCKHNVSFSRTATVVHWNCGSTQTAAHRH
jgi:hypothetical protein